MVIIFFRLAYIFIIYIINMKSYIKKLLREFASGLNEDYFDATLPDNIKRLSNRYVGRGVTWYGDPNQMIVIHKDYVDGMWGNIYDSDKFNYVVELIDGSEENVEFDCSYAIGNVIGLADIREHQEAVYSGRFDIDYEGVTRAASTGNNVLDAYIGNEDYMDEEYGLSTDELIRFFRKNKYALVEGVKSVDELRDEFLELEYDDNDEYAFDEFIDMEESLKYTVDNEFGNIGDFRIQLRDGHHRVMGAIEAGENYICVNLDKGDVKLYADKITRVTNKGG
jgi:hypothetical protein